MTSARVTVAVCDDDDALRRMLSEHLSKLGYEVLQAENALLLLAQLQDRTPELILLDIRMTGQDGLSALRDIRGNSQVPVIMLTAASDIVDKVLGLELGADDYLVKPVD